MNTKYPKTGNHVSSRRRRGRGIALISVIAVLVLLALVATPFLMTMNDSAQRGESFLYTRRADDEANTLFETVRSELIGSIEDIERRRLDSLPPTTSTASGERPPSDATPTYDTPDEFAMSKAALDRFNQSTAKDHRVWSAEVVDAQSLFNLNNCGPSVLANILGRAEVVNPTTSDKNTITLNTVPESFPKTDGVVRIGSECVKYKQIVGSDLVGCERGFLSSTPGNGLAHDLSPGDAVIPESAYQIATRPFRLRPGAWVRYTNVDQARTISDMGVAALPTADFERLRPYVTAWNGNAVGDGWCNPQLVHNGITAGDQTNLYAKIKNVAYFGPGTTVAVTDGVNYDYAIVSSVRGKDEVLLAGAIAHDYQPDQTRIYCVARSPINVNTADVSTLALVFSGLRIRGKTTSISDKQASDLAYFLKQWTPKPASGEQAPRVPPPPGVFRNWEDMTKALEDARDAGKIDDDGLEAVLRNAMNANDSRLGFSTVPFVFRSYDVFEVRAVVSIQGTGGHELARREMRRVMEVSTTKSGTFVLDTQEDFQNQIIKSRDSKYMATFPVNVNAHYDGVNVPPSEFKQFATNNLFPSVDRTLGVGFVTSCPAAFRYGATNDRADYVEHFDEERIPDGYDLSKPFTMSVDAPYDPAGKQHTLDLVDKVDIPGVADNVELGMKEFACSFWYRPEWDRDKAEHVIFDYGNDNDYMNRISLRYDPQLDALVLAVDGATREKQSCEVVYTFDKGTWTAKEWYHVGVHVHGCGPGQMELFIDGDQVGQSSIMTRLTGSISSSTTGSTGASVAVENAKYFPQTGVLLLRGKQGMELMEYSAHSDTEFTVTRRKARSVNRTQSDTTLRQHDSGDIVELYGFAGPLLCDVMKGGATLDSGIGPWRAYRFTLDQNNYDAVTYATSAKPPAHLTLVGMGHPAASTTITAALQDWDTGDPTTTAKDLGQAGTEGIAMIISPLYSTNFVSVAVDPDSKNLKQNDKVSYTQIGGVEFVGYTVGSTPGQVQIVKRDLQLRHAHTQLPSDGNPRFMPSYGYGDTNHTVNGRDFGNQGLGNAIANGGSSSSQVYAGPCTAFIPIAVVGRGNSNAQYIDPLDKEPQLPYSTSPYIPNVHLVNSYVQIDGEWISYDVFDTNAQGGLLTAGKVAFYRDSTLLDLAAIQSSSGTPIIPFNNNNSGLDLTFNFGGAQQTTVQGGGSGGNSSSDAPAAATDFNNETGYQAPAAGQTTNQLPPPPVRSDEIAAKLNFRSYKTTGQYQYLVANTLPNTHSSGIPIVPSFFVYPGNCIEKLNIPAINAGAVFAYPGFNDLVTLRDVRGNDEQIRIQWGWMGYCAATQQTNQTWRWDRPSGTDLYDALRRWDSRAWTRALKFPCGEMPDSALTKAKQDIQFARKYDGAGGNGKATIDEIAFWTPNTTPNGFQRATKDRPDYAFLGTVPATIADGTAFNPPKPGAGGTAQQQQITFDGIDEKVDEFTVHMPFLTTNVGIQVNGLPIEVNTYARHGGAAHGGVLKIDDELILYQDFDATNGHFTNCLRGAFGTQPKSHQYEAKVVPIYTFPYSKLNGSVDENSADYQLDDATDFPDDGYLRIGNNNEIIGYTNWSKTDLTAPLARIDPTTDVTHGGQTDKKSAGSLFRGRYGTIPASSNSGEVAIAMPFRVYDRYAEHADDPEQSYLQLSWTKYGAVWKRITWDAEPKNDVEVVALIRFSGGPAWDSDRIIHVGQDQMPTDDRRKYLYQITDQKAENLINVEADRVEVRLGFRYDKGAYDRLATVVPDYWKEAPTVRKVVVEYVAPPQVLTQE